MPLYLPLCFRWSDWLCHGKRALFTIFSAKTTTRSSTSTTTSSGAAVTIPTLPGLPNFSTSGVAGVPFVLPEFSPCPQVSVSNLHIPKDIKNRAKASRLKRDFKMLYVHVFMGLRRTLSKDTFIRSKLYLNDLWKYNFIFILDISDPWYHLHLGGCLCAWTGRQLSLCLPASGRIFKQYEDENYMSSLHWKVFLTNLLRPGLFGF